MKRQSLQTMKVWLCLLGTVIAVSGYAQRMSVKHNLVYDIWATPNLSIEVGLNSHWSIDTQVGANFFLYNKNPLSSGYTEKKFSHVLIQPGVRYWWCQRPMKWFAGAHLLGGVMNVGKTDIPFILQNKEHVMKYHRYEGWFAGFGVSVGYQYPLDKHWALEGELGLGYASVWYDKFRCVACGQKVGSGRADYLGPTKAALSVVYHF